MTKTSKANRPDRQRYCVRFTETSCYKITLEARSERHAIRLAKGRWYRGSTDAFVPFSGDTDAWDAERE